jgi:hypothetical protein
MRVSTVAVLASTLFGFASAQKFQQVEVGTPDAKLVFNPPTVDGFGPGDVIQFIFYPKAHSVTQSTFANPCTYNGTGVNTGLQSYGNDQKPAMLKSWNFTLPSNSSADKPMWFFCANPGHCEKGMVFSINPGKGKTPDGTPTSHEAYVAKAMSVPAPGTSGAPGSNSTTGGAGTNSTASDNSAAGNSAAGNGASSTAGASAGAASTSAGAPGAAPTSGAVSVARNSAGALAALGVALALLL